MNDNEKKKQPQKYENKHRSSLILPFMYCIIRHFRFNIVIIFRSTTSSYLIHTILRKIA